MIFVFIWVFLMPLNVLFLFGQSILYWSTLEIDWALNATVATIGHIIIALWAVREAYWYPVN